MLRSFLPSSMPPPVRLNYRHEITAVMTWPVAVAMIEGAVTGILAKKAFEDTPDWIIATLAAAPAVSNVTSLVWARLVNGRRTLRNLNLLQCGVIALIVFIAFLPRNEMGLYLFTAAAVMARLLMTGVVTLRAVLWRANYPRDLRPAITGNFITVQTAIISVSGLTLGWLMDADPDSFHYVYAGAAGIGLVGVWMFSRLRIRRPFLLHESAAPRDEPPGTAVGGLIAEWALTLRAMIRIMRDDTAYRGYMVCMFIMGMSNLAIDAPLIKMADETFHLEYLEAILLLQAIPLAMIPIVIPLWARLLKRSHVIRFRAIHSWVFVAMQVLVFLAASKGSVGLLALALIVKGIGIGGGALAWNLGHNDFAPAHSAGLYMTIHVTLTGVRGLIAAYLGMWLYAGVTVDGVRFDLLGEYSFLLWASLGAMGALGFVYLNWRLRHLTGERPSSD